MYPTKQSIPKGADIKEVKNSKVVSCIKIQRLEMCSHACEPSSTSLKGKLNGHSILFELGAIACSYYQRFFKHDIVSQQSNRLVRMEKHFLLHRCGLTISSLDLLCPQVQPGKL